jgi:segregation and condensation protein B
VSDNGNTQPPEDLLGAAVEAVLFAAGEPVPPRDLGAAFGGVDEKRIVELAEALDEDYRRRGSGLRVERVGGGFRLATRSDVGPWVRQFFRQRNRARLSPAALETLAIVAYRQPITSPEIQAIRGVDSSASLKNLVEKKLVRILGKKKVVGNPLLYGTSKHFLVHFGLDRLEDLPPIDDFNEMLGVASGEVGPISAPVAASLAGAGEEEGLFDLSEEE